MPSRLVQYAASLLLRIIQRCTLVYSTKVAERDAQYQEKIKVRVDQDDIRCELMFGRESIIKLTRLIKATEKALHRVCVCVCMCVCTYVMYAFINVCIHVHAHC